MVIERVTPRGYYTFGDYIGFLPDGSTQRYSTEREYEEDFKEILDEAMEKEKEKC